MTFRYGTLEYYQEKFAKSPSWRSKEEELAINLEVILTNLDGMNPSNDEIADHTRNLMQAYQDSRLN